ncbi:MAG: SDR family NAD(P)-dependent oxidoreductase [Vulcanimicrobiota bacterium]
MELRNRVALITGASSGIGKEVALNLAAKGTRVAIVSNVPDELAAVLDEIESKGGNAIALEADLGDLDQVSTLVPESERALGPLDILVNNAGIGLHKTLLESTDAEFDLLFRVNFFATVRLCRDALTSMAGRGRGSIVNVSSASGRRALSRMTAYASTKGAMHALSQALRLEAAPLGVAVTEVLPISVATPFFSAAGYRPKGLVQTPQWVAQQVVVGILTGRAEVYPSRLSQLALALDGLFPNLVARALAWREVHSS